MDTECDGVVPEAVVCADPNAQLPQGNASGGVNEWLKTEPDFVLASMMMKAFVKRETCVGYCYGEAKHSLIISVGQ